MHHLVANVPLIILAAGQSTRMGFPKGLIEIDGKKLISSHLEHFWKCGGQKIIVVLGDSFAQYFPLLQALERKNDIVTIINDKIKLGPFYSIQLALKALDPLTPGAFIRPIDSAPLSSDVYSLLTSNSLMLQKKVSIPTSSDGKGGHPILLNRLFIQQLLIIDPGHSSYRLDFQIRHLPLNEISRVSCDDPSITTNLNTPDDLVTKK
ncbi:MAG: hypothetical protein A2504_00030 [Bdellovibrionales bacterium RIFOXYD12_FULL_39_22]|nr:MAG: hypothetical protein A2385_14995 [Bdellovibrionales bacterium RIFOXYB1_FULL_39_21]OFZ43746.1 MAG: hypothetical protein A2485_07820 [Bdellovibrionales bacterium RIFOXYC12_FULL_39_17]OFZ48083.1 MAG: hypothetical protein A2404_15670 [Bdellovibrionales bacterium RIFOXYC1_FULL_39_130]OFZ73781.1 MAG: hypothetical protein A2451_13615 [Bdellovibrionales bacterium RIFOXYC2_FULL_39_8]OFZ77254.1 MAG: hypothetical protein A2560_08315 [Bdellovibrionales bacterium RIFOXYD1_FULL_39_84]OFZ95686.1 MAG: